MKKCSYLLLFVLCLFLGINGVEAAQYDSCVEKGTCIVLCDYASQIKLGGGYETGYQNQEVTRNITLYYLLDSDNLKLTWEGRERDPHLFSKTGKANSNDIFGSKVYNKTSKSMNSENFTCPKFAYTDGAALGANNEICFDDDGKTCANSSNFGTKFGTADSAFISVKQIENYNTNLSKYLDDNMFKDIASDISSGKFKVKDELGNHILTSVKDNFLHGYSIPEFIKNNETYKSFADKAYASFEKAKEKELKKCENGQMTDEECKEAKENWNVSEEEIKKEVNKFYDAINNDKDVLNNIYDWDIGGTCDSYLGAINDKNAPAYYLHFAFNLLKYAAILMLFIFTVVDFAKAIPSGKDDALPSALKNTLKRFIIAVIIFFIPIIIDFVFQVLGITSSTSCVTGK